MKHNNNNNNNNTNNNTHNIPDLDIIDLDTIDLDEVSEDPEVGPMPDLPDDMSEDDISADISFDAISSDAGTSDTAPSGAVSSDNEQPEENLSEEDIYDDAEDTGKSSFPSAILHIVFVLIVFLIIGLLVWRIWNYGDRKDLADYEGNYSAEVLDSIMPLIPKEGVTVEDDGKTTIVAFGNAPFADDRDSEDSLANIIEGMTGATVYNCSVGSSYLAAEGATLSADIAPMDAFNFYWLTTAFCLRNNDFVYQNIFDVLGDDMPEDGPEAYETLLDIDFNTVDVIVIMYDGSDYLAGHNMYSDQNDTDIQQFTGNMCAGIDLIQETYPHIRIIVMSPTYAFAVNEEGEYVSSDQYIYNDQDVLSTYVIKQFGYAYDRSVTFVDNIYGTITEDNATQYLTDNIHLNVDGRRLVAERFVYALNYFNKQQSE